MEREQLISIIKNNLQNKRTKLIINEEISIEELEILTETITNNINQVDINLLTKAINYINKNIENYNIDNDIKYFKAIQLLENYSDNLSAKYKITNEQKEYIKKLISKLNSQIEKEKNNVEINNSLSSKINEIIDLLPKLSNNNEYIEEVDLINEILEEEQVDYETRYNILVYILKQNKELFISRQVQSEIKNIVEEVKLSEEAKETTEDKLTKIKEIFQKHTRNFDEIDEYFQEQFINYGNLTNIEEMIKIAISIGLKENDHLFSLLLLYSNKEIFNNLNNISKESSILMKELIKYPGIFLQTTPFENTNIKELDIHKPIPSYNIFINNYNIIKNLGFKYDELYKSLSAEIVGNCDTIISNLKLTRLYKLPASSRREGKEYSYYAMSKKETFQKIDRFIELGLYNYIKCNISVIAPRPRIAKTIYALQNNPNILKEEIRQDLGTTQVINDNYIKSIPDQIASEIQSNWINIDLTNEKFKTYREILRANQNTDINLDLISNNNIITLLEENYRKDEVTYDIDGVLISRLKVLRIFTTLYNNGYTDDNSLMYAIVYNSLITQEQLHKIQDFFINSYTRGGRA